MTGLSILYEKVKNELDQIKRTNLFRFLDANTSFNNNFIDVSHNDYLNLRNNNEFQMLAHKNATSLPCSAGGSRLLGGEHGIFQQVESEFSDFKGCDSSLFLPSGFTANEILGVAFSQLNAHIFSDELNHASIIDGIKLGKNPQQKKSIFPHNNMNVLEDLLKKSDCDLKVIYCESLYSMDGDFANLRDLYALSNLYQAILVVDEAHATGCFGKQGRGYIDALNISHANIISMSTCGKALGTQGAFIGCPQWFKDYIINKARAFIYSTGPSPVIASFTQTSLRYTAKLENERLHLSKISQLFRSMLNEVGIDTGLSQSHIIPVIVGSSEKALYVSKKLLEQHIIAKAIRPPTVALNSSRVRISLNCGISESQILYMTDIIKSAME